MDLKSLRKALEAEKYVFDEELLMTLYIALKLEKPLLIEGAAGVGKTEVAKVLALIYEENLIRLQCYEGLDESKALYEWNYHKQLLSIQMDINKNKEKYEDESPLNITNLFSEKYLLKRPLLKALTSKTRSVLLIDEIDKSGEEFEAFLLEILSDFQISIPELGTIKAITNPIVILTSNNTRELSDALKRRCVYLYIDYPSIEKEKKIILKKVPKAEIRLAKDVASAIAYLRANDKVFKKPSIAETIDWVLALVALNKKKIDLDGIEKTLGLVLKNREDIVEFKKSGGFDGFFNS
jgi:MoxR-like ATPase